MSTGESLKQGLAYPSLLFRPVNRVFFPSPGDGIDIFDTDWDNLIILDACRYDIFEDENTIKGDLSKKQSRGSATREWVTANFDRGTNQNLHDTVYVDCNGWYRSLSDELAEIHAGVWLHGAEYRVENGTVPPRLVSQAALTAAENYPNKRLLVHYIQPHRPYLGPTAGLFSVSRSLNMVQTVAQSEASDAELRQAYRETLRIALDEVERLVNGLAGKTVVSSDHGELLGERYWRMPLRNYGHPIGIRVPELVDIPWLACPYDSRREIVEEPPERETDGDDEGLEDHLRALGYR